MICKKKHFSNIANSWPSKSAKSQNFQRDRFSTLSKKASKGFCHRSPQFLRTRISWRKSIWSRRTIWHWKKSVLKLWRKKKCQAHSNKYINKKQKKSLERHAQAPRPSGTTQASAGFWSSQNLSHRRPSGATLIPTAECWANKKMKFSWAILRKYRFSNKMKKLTNSSKNRIKSI